MNLKRPPAINANIIVGQGFLIEAQKIIGYVEARKAALVRASDHGELGAWNNLYGPPNGQYHDVLQFLRDMCAMLHIAPDTTFSISHAEMGRILQLKAMF